MGTEDVIIKTKNYLKVISRGIKKVINYIYIIKNSSYYFGKLIKNQSYSYYYSKKWSIIFIKFNILNYPFYLYICKLIYSNYLLFKLTSQNFNAPFQSSHSHSSFSKFFFFATVYYKVSIKEFFHLINILFLY